MKVSGTDPDASRTRTIPTGTTSGRRVGVTVRVADPAGVGVMVTVDVTVAVSVNVPVGVVVADPAGVGVAVAVDVTVAFRETNLLRVGVAVAETDGERTGEAVTDATTVAVVVSVNQGAGTGVMVVPGTMPATVAGDACNAVGTGMGVAVATACPATPGARTTRTASPATTKAATIPARHHLPDGPPMATPRLALDPAPLNGRNVPVH